MADLLLLQTSTQETTTVTPAAQDSGTESLVDLGFFEQLDAQAAQAQGAQQDPPQEQPGAELTEDVTAPFPLTTSA